MEIVNAPDYPPGSLVFIGTQAGFAVAKIDRYDGETAWVRKFQPTARKWTLPNPVNVEKIVGYDAPNLRMSRIMFNAQQSRVGRAV